MLNKNVYIVDCQSMYYLDDLRQELIKEIKSDTLENNDDTDIVKSNLNLLEKVCNEKWKYNENFIIDELKAFGIQVAKVNDVLYNLRALESFLEFNTNLNKINYELKNKVNNLIEDLKKYFNN